MKGEIRKVEEIMAYSEADNPWLMLFFDRVEFPDGTRGRYNRIVEAGGKAGVAILPLAEGRIGLVRQYRYAVAEFLWEIPRGYGGGEDPHRAAVRELVEETGLKADRMVPLGPVFPNSAVLSTKVDLFAGLCSEAHESTPRDSREIAEFRWFSRQEFSAAVNSDEISDAITLAAVFKATAKGLVKF